MSSGPNGWKNYAPRKGEKLWRYLNLYKFLDLIISSELTFSRLHVMEDPAEGKSTNAEQEKTKEKIISEFGEDFCQKCSANILEMDEFLKSLAFVSCWYLSNYEDILMWKAYSSVSSGILIQVEANNFIENLITPLSNKQDITSLVYDRVKYIDFSSNVDNSNNWVSKFFRKDLAWSGLAYP